MSTQSGCLFFGAGNIALQQDILQFWERWYTCFSSLQPPWNQPFTDTLKHADTYTETYSSAGKYSQVTALFQNGFNFHLAILRILITYFIITKWKKFAWNSCKCIKNETLPFPWRLLAGSGGLADFPSDVLDNLSPAPPVQSPGEGDGEEGPSVDLKDKVEEHFKKHFPSKPQTDELVHLVCADWDNTCTWGNRWLTLWINSSFITKCKDEQIL